MSTIRQARSDEFDQVLDLITAQQQDPARACIFLGTERDGILAELDELGEWRSTVLVAEDDGVLTGAVLSDSDTSLGRGWIHGPWATGDWLPTARSLLLEAVAALPPEIATCEIGSDIAHAPMAELAAELGWTATEVSHVYVADRAAGEAWQAEDPRVRQPRPEDAETIAPLHDREFPATYTPVDRLMTGAADGSLLVAVADGDGFLGYAAGRVQPDGEGYLDYLAVAESARGRGVGEALVSTLGRRILAASPRGTVNLTVQDHRSPAVALYERLGFRRECSMVGYRSPVAATS
ncbi:GNAT family N-acetyltransferase [Nocardioides insulae]|uniref:GNAT family N-acetyltransferase n=1 Tax=Nocardioides insulae TaxID=394734 RepID=UPI0003FB5874|nr:GNAT family N-acetyltransferase [Nocardioides insulae]